MIMDLGQQLQGRAEQMAVQPGAAQSQILSAVKGRTGQFGSEAAARIARTLDQSMGKPQNTVALIDAVDNMVQQQAGPAYKSLMEKYKSIPVPPEITSRPAVQSAMGQAESIAANYGEKVSGTSPDLRILGLRQEGLWIIALRV